MIGSPTTLITSGQRSRHFSPSSSINNDKASLQPVIADLHTIKKSICEYCGIIGHKADACIIRGPKFLPPSIRRNMNKFNAINGDEKNEPLREWNSQTLVAHFKSRTSPYKTNPAISDTKGILNHHAIDNGDYLVHPSYFPVEFNSEYVSDLFNTPIISIDGDEMDHLLILFHSEDNEDILDVDIQMLQDWLVFTSLSKLYNFLLCCFIKMEERMFQSNVAYDTFLVCPNQGLCEPG